MTACSYDYTEPFDFGYEVTDCPIYEYQTEIELFPRIKYPFKKQFKSKETHFKAETTFKKRSDH